ncbi:flagellar basal body rod protein FlgB [Caldibacillus thermolactis]|jgi:flagellar basal-body rod protein FlgB|uniref:Flagellar basal body rod protein FlgB n=1 Tax=Pallidibacillus thermolactis TaxID=251051 RepID=A0ABT2WE69_9BACI|nr:flagellar basal body rod protein FlgB [Pallidibacillus thermolactis]MCU9593099.1 flagellar basal body rod protein FlgB [Pallidibacillus thermolactis]MCU9600137.1 flagellar basal body rod protein FlgB [Pallidibacillus thermolactis subsp. kokeshiiformis]MED1672000.1 flagellar basal body rod protein FlgB [Pallidibacillus thermolactis subsp. kokeshiiformis]
MSLFSHTIHVLDRALDYSALKQKTISNNIANVDTPQYKAQDVVSFKKFFNQELSKGITAKRSNEKHIPFQSSTKSLTITHRNVQFNENGNSVNMDQEMAKLADNQIYYNAMIERLNGKFNTLKNVIKGGQ